MLTLDQALAEVLAQAAHRPPVQLPLADSLGSILREDLLADRPIPPFDRVTMDGFAIRSQDFQAPHSSFYIIGEQPAGAKPVLTIEAGQAIRTMTGAMLPLGADAIIQVENTSEADGQVTVTQERVQSGLNIAKQGEDAQQGTRFLGPGQVITPSLIAFAASVGKAELLVGPALSLAVLSTGDEIVPPENQPEDYQIRDANGPALIALGQELGIHSSFLGICPDQEEALKSSIAKGLESDILLLSGGVSMGDYDLVPKIFKELGVTEVFHKVYMKPGKPIWFGRGPKGCYVFGLPGNPVSAQVGFKLFVEPLALRLLGHNRPEPQYLQLPLAQAIKKKNPRETFIPAVIVSLAGQSFLEERIIRGSGDFSNLILSDGLMRFPAESKGASAKEMVSFLPWRRL